MTLKFKDGTVREIFIPVAKTISQPLSRDGAMAKFRTLTDGLIAADRQTRIVEAVMGLEAVEDTGVLVDLLRPTVGAAF